MLRIQPNFQKKKKIKKTFLLVLEARGLKSGCCQGSFLLEAPRENPFQALLLSLVAVSNSWHPWAQQPRVAQIQPLSSCGLLPLVCVCAPFLSLIRTPLDTKSMSLDLGPSLINDLISGYLTLI